MKIVIAEPGSRLSIAALYASGSTLSSEGKDSKETSRPLYASLMFLCKCCSIYDCQWCILPLRFSSGKDLLIAGNLDPFTPTMLSLPTFPLRRRSKSVNPTTPTFLSEVDAPPPTKPVVYSPVPTYYTLQSASSPASLLTMRQCAGCCTYHQHAWRSHFEA